MVISSNKLETYWKQVLCYSFAPNIDLHLKQSFLISNLNHMSTIIPFLKNASSAIQEAIQVLDKPNQIAVNSSQNSSTTSAQGGQPNDITLLKQQGNPQNVPDFLVETQSVMD